MLGAKLLHELALEAKGPSSAGSAARPPGSAPSSQPVTLGTQGLPSPLPQVEIAPASLGSRGGLPWAIHAEPFMWHQKLETL